MRAGRACLLRFMSAPRREPRVKPKYVTALRQRHHGAPPPPLSEDLRELFVDARAEDFGAQFPATLATYGVAVATGVLDPDDCTAYTHGIVDTIARLSDGVDARDVDTWRDPARLLPQVSPGVFRCGVGNCAAVWAVRSDPRVVAVFAAAFGVPAHDLVTSVEMIHVRPPVPPFHDPAKSDWAHTDNHGLADMCLQGQVVLADAAFPEAAGFVCSPRSHVRCAELVRVRRECGSLNEGPGRARAAALVVEAGGRFQVPVHAPRGSVFVFLSSTLHSAKLADPGVVSRPPPAVPDPWFGWRCVVYVSYRPKVDVDLDHLKGLWRAVATNGVTRHTGIPFPPKALDEYPEAGAYTPAVAHVHAQLTQESRFPFADMEAVPTPDLMRLLGLVDEDVDPTCGLRAWLRAKAL